jgi:hypothetical protein
VKTATNSVHNIGLISMIRSENLKSIHREWLPSSKAWTEILGLNWATLSQLVPMSLSKVSENQFLGEIRQFYLYWGLASLCSCLNLILVLNLVLFVHISHNQFLGEIRHFYLFKKVARAGLGSEPGIFWFRLFSHSITLLLSHSGSRQLYLDRGRPMLLSCLNLVFFNLGLKLSPICRYTLDISNSAAR